MYFITIKIHITSLSRNFANYIFIYACVHAKLLQLCLTLCNPMDYSPPGLSIHGNLQAKILECVAISSSRGSSFKI